MPTKIIIVLPCHNQEDIVKVNLELLKKQTRVPDHVIVVDDHSDNQTMRSSEDGWLLVVQGADRGRSTTRNRGIQEALENGADIVSFMDGDSLVEDDCFVERLLTHMGDHNLETLMFGTRIHSERPYDLERWVAGENVPTQRFANKPSDLLTANMDNMMRGADLDFRDLRVVANVLENYSKLETFDDRADFILTGMLTWSCNFAVTRSALDSLQELMAMVYGLRGMWFDEVTFRTQWGYEDVAFGLDALFAGVDVQIQDTARVVHFMHGRSDDLYSHIQGKHLIMDRYRALLRFGGVPSGITVTKSTISIHGRSFDLDLLGNGAVCMDRGNLTVGNFLYDWETGDFKKSSLVRILLSKVQKALQKLKRKIRHEKEETT